MIFSVNLCPVSNNSAVKLLSTIIKQTTAKAAERLKKNITCKDKQMPSTEVLLDDYSHEFVMYNETGIDISLTVAYHRKFHHKNKKKQPYIVCWYVRFRWHQSRT